jgi:hypothetical protein
MKAIRIIEDELRSITAAPMPRRCSIACAPSTSMGVPGLRSSGQPSTRIVALAPPPLGVGPDAHAST